LSQLQPAAVAPLQEGCHFKESFELGLGNPMILVATVHGKIKQQIS